MKRTETFGLVLVMLSLLFQPTAFADDDVDLDGALSAFRQARENPQPIEPEPSIESDSAPETVNADVNVADGDTPENAADSEDLADEVLNGALLEGDIDLDDLTDEASKEAIQHLHRIQSDGTINTRMSIDSRAVGAALLYQSREELLQTLDQIVNSLKNAGDYDRIRIAFNPSVYPSVKTSYVDEVQVIKSQMEERAKEVQKRYEATLKKWNANNTRLFSKFEGPDKFKMLSEDSQYTKLQKQLKDLEEENGGQLPDSPAFRISISAGLLAFIENLDELAAVIAQAMSRANPKVFLPLQEADVREVISKVKNLKNLHKEEQEIIKADLAAIERLATSGYVPWALKRFEVRVLKRLEEKFLKKRIYALNRGLMGRSLRDAKEDPLRPIRHAAMEHWVATIKQKNKGIQKHNRPLPTSMVKLQKRLKRYVKPLYSLAFVALTPVVGATAIFFGGPVVASLAALGAEGAAGIGLALPSLPAISLPSIPVLSTIGAVLGEVGTGIFATVAGSGSLYLGYKNREVLGNATRAVVGTVKNVAVNGPRVLIAGTRTRSGRLLIGTQNTVTGTANAAANATTGTARALVSGATATGNGLVAGGRALVNGTIASYNGTIAALKWTGNGFVRVAISSKNALHRSLITANRVLLIAPYQGAKKKVIMISDQSQQLLDAKRERSKAIALYNDFSLERGDSIDQLRKSFEQIHQDFSDQTYKSGLLQSRIRRNHKVFHPAIYAMSPRTAMRASATRSHYYSLLERLIKIIETQDVAMEDLEKLFENYKSFQVPLDIMDSSEYQELLIRLGLALKNKGFDGEFAKFDFDGVKQAFQKVKDGEDRKEFNLLDLVAIFSQLHSDLESKDYLHLLEWPTLLQNYNFKMSSIRLVNKTWLDVLKTYVDHFEQLSDDQKSSWQEFVSNQSTFRGDIKLRAHHIDQLTADQALLIYGLKDSLRIKDSKKLKSAAIKSIEEIAKATGSLSSTRTRVFKLKEQHDLQLDDVLEHLFSLNETEALKDLSEVVLYLNYLNRQVRAGVEIPVKTLSFFIRNLVAYYPSTDPDDIAYAERPEKLGEKKALLQALSNSIILKKLSSSEIISSELTSELGRLFDLVDKDNRLFDAKSTGSTVKSEDYLEANRTPYSSIGDFHPNPISMSYYLPIFEKYAQAKVIDAVKSSEFLETLKYFSTLPSHGHENLRSYLRSNLAEIINVLTTQDVSNRLLTSWVEFLDQLKQQKFGKGYTLSRSDQKFNNQGLVFETFFGKSEIRKIIDPLPVDQKAKLLGAVLQIENRKAKDDKLNGKTIKTYFGSRSLHSKKLQTIIHQFAEMFTRDNRTMDEMAKSIKEVFPDGFESNPMIVALLLEISKSKPKVRSFAELERLLESFRLIKAFKASESLKENTKTYILDILAHGAVALIGKSKAKDLSWQFDKFIRVNHYTESFINSTFKDFPRPSLVELSIALDSADNWTREGYLDRDASSIDTTHISLEYLADVSRAYASLKTEFNPKLALKLIPHIIRVGTRDAEWFRSLRVNEGAQETLARMFESYGSELSKYVFSQDASLTERNAFFSMVERVSYNKRQEATQQHGGKLNQIITGKKMIFKGPEINDIVTKQLDANQISTWRTLRDAYGHSSRFDLLGLSQGRKRTHKQINRWIEAVNSMVEFDNFIKSELQGRGARMQRLASSLYDAIKGQPRLIKSLADAHAMLENDSYWPEANLDLKSGDINPEEVEFVKIIQKRKDDPLANKGSWTYKPAFSEEAHKFIVDNLKVNGAMPSDFDGLFNLWVSLTNRGVTSVSDNILNQLMGLADDSQTASLEDMAIKEQRIFETTSRDDLVLRKIQESPQYQDLIEQGVLDEDERFDALKYVVAQMQYLMPERGLKYDAFLEDLSVEIMSSQRESQYLNSQKGFAESDADADESTEDNSIQALNKVINAVKSWPDKEKFNFIVFLRGDSDPSDYIRSRFPTIGAERVQRMYQILPVEYRLGVINFFLGETFFQDENVDIRKGYPRKLIEQAITGGVQETDEKKLQAQDVTRQILLAGLHGINKGSGDPEFQKTIIANILAVSRNSEGSVGQTLKLVLEQGFGPLGVKIGQLIVAMNILDRDDAKALVDVQDNARPLKRNQQYKEFEQILGNPNLPFTMKELLGSASIKWAIEGQMNHNQQRVAIKVFREEVEAMLHSRYEVLEEMVNYLVKHVGPEYRILKAIVDSAKRAVEKELDGEAEVNRSKYARENIYINLDDETSQVKVPREDFESGRLIVSEFVDGTSFHRLPESIKHIAAQKILSMEGDILFADSDEITFDPDRHGGNYRIHLPNYDGQRHIVFEPIQYGVIDFGQLLTIEKDVRTNLINIFALSQIISESGTNKILTEKLGSIFGLEDQKLVELGKVLRSYFPNPKLKEQTAYFATLSALHEVGVKLDAGYFDFARAVMQLMQYEPYVPKDYPTPSRILQSQIVEKIAEHLRDIASENPTKIAMRNGWNWVESKFSSKAYRPITTQIDSEAVMAFKFDGSVWEDDKKPSTPVTPAVFGFTCEAQFR